MKNIDALIIDMDGVVWQGDSSIGDLGRIHSMLVRIGLPYRFATNNSTRSRKWFSDKLSQLGWPASPELVLTSSFATSHYLAAIHPLGGAVIVIGEAGLEEALSENAFYPSVDNPLAVVVGLDRKISYEKLSAASLAIQRGIPFIGTNPDSTLPTVEGLVPGAGSLLAALEAATGIKPRIIGKPQPDILWQAAQQMKVPAGRCLVIGDRLETDIAGGQAAGCRTALVLSGVATEQMSKSWHSSPPDLIANDLYSVLETLS